MVVEKRMVTTGFYNMKWWKEDAAEGKRQSLERLG